MPSRNNRQSKPQAQTVSKTVWMVATWIWRGNALEEDTLLNLTLKLNLTPSEMRKSKIKKVSDRTNYRLTAEGQMRGGDHNSP